MNNNILKELYDEFLALSFSSEGISPFPNEEWQKGEDAFNEFAQRLSLSNNDRASLENDVISELTYKSGLEGFMNGFKLATRLFVGK